MNGRRIRIPQSHGRADMDDPVSDIYDSIDNDLAWDNLEQDLPRSELAELEYSFPRANGEDF